MKKLVFLFVAVLISSSGLFSQTYNIATENGNIVSTCSGTFYDSGGSGSGYSDNENYQVTFCSDQPGSQISFDFTEYNVESSYEYLTAYEGTGTLGTLLGVWTGTSIPYDVASISSGCVTFTFTSDGIGSGGSGYTGWTATIDCSFPCQNFDVAIVSVSEPYSNGDTVDVCQGQPITFSAGGTYTNNNVNYTQSDATTDFIWDFGDGTPTATGQTVTHTFPDGGGSFVTMEGIDVNGCDNVNFEMNVVRVSTTPTFDGTVLMQDTICLGESVDFDGQVNTQPWAQSIPPPYAQTTFLPDDASGFYETPITYEIFDQGQTLTNPNDIGSVCITMEHSYLGDLTIQLLCPNGQSIDFTVYSNGCGMTYLGEPIDDDGNLNPGVGYEYCWTPVTSNGTFSANCGSVSTLPAGDYSAESPWTDLVGCPLNGDWSIYVFDNLASDNGYIFEWMINFDPSIIPTNLMEFENSYTPPDLIWICENDTIISETGSATPQGTGDVPLTFEATDDFGCSYDTTITVYVLPAGSPGCCAAAQPNAGPDDAVCGNSYTLSVVGSSGSWSFTGPGTATFSDFDNVVTNVSVDIPGSYDFTWTEVSGSCSNTDLVTITFNPTLSPLFTYSDSVNCFEDPISVIYAGNATAAATYTWNFGTATATGSGQGPYNVVFQNGSTTVSLNVVENGCSADTTITITSPTELIAKPGQQNNICNGYCTAYIYMGVEGGTPQYNYSWASGADTLSNLCAGDYSCTVTDAGGCTVAGSFTITEPTAITAYTTVTDAHCNQADGTATVIPSGGTVAGDYTYLWDLVANSQTTATAIDIPSGIYFVTVTDDNDCTFDTIANVGNLAGVTDSLGPITHVTCFGLTDGSATISVTGGTPDFTYLWSHIPVGITTSATSNSQSGLGAGLYTVSVTDIAGCTSADFFTITEPEQLTGSIIGTNVSCYGGSDGTANLTADGGTQPWVFLWSDNSVTEDLAGIPSGGYTVTITDDNLCTTLAYVSITQPSTPVNGTIIENNVSCYAGSDGMLNLSPGGGTPGTGGYTYVWSNSETTQDIDNLPIGTYYVTITDDNLCTYETSGIITQPDSIEYTTDATNASCFGVEDGTASISVTGGTAPFFYMWSNDIPASSISHLAADAYSVTATDNNGCTVSASVDIYEPDEVQLSASIDRIICYGEAVNINASATGGNPPYTYYWSGAITTTGSIVNISPTENSIYSVRAIDALGCISLPDIVKISVRAPITAQLNVSEDSICEGEYVEFSFDINGGYPPYTYEYIVGIDTTEISNPGEIYPATSNQYYIIVTDTCSNSQGFDDTLIVVHELPSVNFEANSKKGCEPFTPTFLNQIAFDQQTFAWEFNDPYSISTSELLNPSHTFINAGEYTVSLHVTTKYGCENSFTRENYIQVNPVPEAAFEIEPTIASIIDPRIVFTNMSTTSDDCKWEFGDGYGVDDNCNPVYYYKESGEYSIRLIVETNEQCADTAYDKVQIINEYTYYCASAFTPDDDGVNDLFSPKIHGLKRGSYMFRIYNRWGHLMFETTKYDVDDNGTINFGWDGRVHETRISATKEVPPGVYQYYVKYTDQANIEHEESGSVTVIR